jgi:membrane dipeptidase
MAVSRRQFVVAGLAAPFALARRAMAAAPIYIGDMHFHLFFVGPRPAGTQPLGRNMAGGQATLVAWALVGDQPWLAIAPGGFKQSGTPDGKKAVAWLHEELARITDHIAAQELTVVRTAADVDRALAGEPHVVLSVEGATFADEDPGQIEAAYDAGIRQIQLVHYARNPLADFQTAAPRLSGLTDAGKAIVRECNRLGILVDLAHCTGDAVTEALAIAKAPLVWSHSSVTSDRTPSWKQPVWQARQLSLANAKAIADKGGVVGLWALGADVGRSPETYAARLLEMADWLGEDHVAFGTDMNALARPALTSYSDLRRVIAVLQRRKVPEARIRKLAIENYARVLKAAFAARS